jgi:hypothetical protein
MLMTSLPPAAAVPDFHQQSHCPDGETRLVFRWRCVPLWGKAMSMSKVLVLVASAIVLSTGILWMLYVRYSANLQPVAPSPPVADSVDQGIRPGILVWKFMSSGQGWDSPQTVGLVGAVWRDGRIVRSTAEGAIGSDYVSGYARPHALKELRVGISDLTREKSPLRGTPLGIAGAVMYMVAEDSVNVYLLGDAGPFCDLLAAVESESGWEHSPAEHYGYQNFFCTHAWP